MNFLKLRTLAALLTAVCITAVPVLADEAVETATENASVQQETEGLEGQGTKDSPYLVSSADDLAYVGELASQGKTANVYFALENDVVINEPSMFETVEGYVSAAKDGAVVFAPIGTAEKPFEGVFDGKGYYITGLYCKDVAASGLFGAVNNGEIKNLGVDFALVEAKDFAGVLAGRLDGSSKVENVTVSGSVIGKQQTLSSVVGGIAGVVSENSSVVNSCSYCAVSAANAFSAYAGGVSGINKGIIEKCNFGGNVFATSMYFSANVGGITSSNHGTIKGCRSQGTVGVETASEVNDGNAGGIAGLTDGEIYQCKNDSTVSGYCASYGDSICAVGGIAGYVKNSDIYGCENNGEIIGKQGSYAGGIAGLSVVDDGEHKIYDCLNNGEVNSAYGIAAGVVGRVSVSGYVTNRNELLSCLNTADVSGLVHAGVVGAIYEDSAKVTVNNCYYPAGLADGAPEGTSTVANAGFTSGNAFTGLENSNIWKFEAGKKPAILFADGLARSTSTITAEKSQSFKEGQTVTASGVGTMKLSKNLTAGTYDVTVRFTGDENSFAPASVVISVNVSEAFANLVIKNVDTSALTLTDGILSGKITVYVGSPKAAENYTAVCGVFENGVMKTIGFAPVVTVDGLASIEVNVTSFKVADGGTISVNTLLVENTENLSPACENLEVTVK